MRVVGGVLLAGMGFGCVFGFGGVVPVFSGEVDARWGFDVWVECGVDCGLEEFWEGVGLGSVFPEHVEGLLWFPVAWAEFVESVGDEGCLGFCEHVFCFFLGDFVVERFFSCALSTQRSTIFFI